MFFNSDRVLDMSLCHIPCFSSKMWTQMLGLRGAMRTRTLREPEDYSSLPIKMCKDMGVSKNRGTPKSSILIGFSIINHPFWGTSIFGNTHIQHSMRAMLIGV